MLTKLADVAERLHDNGVPIIPIMPGTKRPVMQGWTDFATRQQTQQDIDSFIEHHPGWGVGIPTGRIIGVDIDLLDEEKAGHCQMLADEILGGTSFIRIGKAPKRMLIYRVAEPIAGWKNHPLEILAKGQQFVAYGIHPDTGEPYTWPLANLIDSPLDEVPLTTEAKLHEWTDACKRYLAGPQSTGLVFDATLVSHTATGAAVAQGERNANAASLVGQWINAGHNDETIALMLADWNANNSPPLTDAELKTIRNSVRRTDSKNNGNKVREITPLNSHQLILKENQDVSLTQRQAFPAHLIENLPGALGWTTNYINETSYKQQPILALAAAIPFIGAVTGRQCELVDWQTRGNIYTLGVAVSGSGKDRAMQAIKDILFAAGRDGYIGTEDIASDTGFLMDLKDNPSNISLIDEFGRVLRLIAQPNAPVHMKGFIDLLLRLRTASRSVHKSKSYADRTRNFTINQPNACIYGTSVPDNFYGSLTLEQISDGFLSRLLIFNTFDHDPPITTPRKVDVPLELIDWVNAWCSRPPGGTSLATIGGHQVIQPVIVGMTVQGRQMVRDFIRKMDDKKRAMRPLKLDHLYVRAPENALKLILIRAVASNSPTGGVMATDADVKWGLELAEYLTDHLADQASRFISDGGFQKEQKIVLREIDDAGPKGLTKRDMARNPALSKYKPRELEEVLATLTTSEHVVLAEIKSGVGRPRLAYVLAKNLSLH